MNTLNSRIRKILMDKNLNANSLHKELSDRVDITRQTCFNILKDGNTVKDTVLQAICEIFEISPEWLLLGSGPMYKAENETKLYQQIDILKAELEVREEEIKYMRKNEELLKKKLDNKK